MSTYSKDYDETEVEIDYDYSPAEAQEMYHPGYSEEVEIIEIRVNGVVVPWDFLEAIGADLDSLEEEILEDREDQEGEAMVDAYLSNYDDY